MKTNENDDINKDKEEYEVNENIENDDINEDKEENEVNGDIESHDINEVKEEDDLDNDTEELSDEEEKMIVVNGVEYQLQVEDNLVLDTEDMEIMGTWNADEGKIDFEDDETKQKHEDRL